MKVDNIQELNVQYRVMSTVTLGPIYLSSSKSSFRDFRDVADRALELETSKADSDVTMPSIIAGKWKLHNLKIHSILLTDAFVDKANSAAKSK